MIGRFVIYDVDTGIIRQVTVGDDESIAEDLLENDAVIKIDNSIANPGVTHYVNPSTQTLQTKEYPLTTLIDIFTMVMLGDSLLNSAIYNYLQGSSNVEDWRKENYKLLRNHAYPELTEYLDAQVKLTSIDPDIVAAGQEQMNKYLADSLAVKERFPKPVV